MSEVNRYHTMMCDVCKIIELQQEIDNLYKHAMQQITANEYVDGYTDDHTMINKCFTSDLALLGQDAWKCRKSDFGSSKFFHIGNNEFAVSDDGYGGIQYNIFKKLLGRLKDRNFRL